ncbi:MAG TPA: 30S ribosomal protein S18 [Dehalococcoidia bacterium]|nr:30S ribosomal protein S18 [Dehalococcoidia bacterium]HLB28708.1 30S ribosomal protein S18 [Dehalococcoidia bacterium]
MTTEPFESQRGSQTTEAPPPPPRRRGPGRPRRRGCTFCADHIKAIDYKDIQRLRRFVSDRARIEPRQRLGTCAKHQRALALAIKRARHLALLPYTPDHIRISGVSTGRP